MSLKTAFENCRSCQFKLDKDWHELSLTEKSNFLELAKSHNYKDPKHPSGRSRGYCFYLGLQRLQNKWESK